MVSSTRRITESLLDHYGPQKQKYLLHRCSRTVHADQHFQWEGDNKQRRARVPPPSHRSTSHLLWWGVITFSARLASAPVRKRLYQIHTRCHYPAQVVSAHYLWPLKFSQCVLKTKKRTQVEARVLQIMKHGSFSDVCWIFQPLQSAIRFLRWFIGNVVFIFAIVKIPHM